MAATGEKTALTFQELLFRLQTFWAERGCVLQQPYDVEVGAGTMSPDTFLRVLGPKPVRIAYAQPSRRPADGRYGENPNRLFRHTQFQVILKPPPATVQEMYLESLEAIGIDLREHDLKFEEDNWEWPVGGAWGVGWQVMLDGLEITQFTYFQQCGGMDLDPICAEITYGLERIAGFLQDVDSIYDIVWAVEPDTGRRVTYGEMRLAEEEQFSAYGFDYADVDRLWEHLRLYEAECLELLGRAEGFAGMDGLTLKRFPVLGAYELALKCSQMFNLLDARGAISVTERVGVMARIRTLVVGVAKAYVGQQGTGNREQGTGNRRAGNREQGTGIRELGNRELGGGGLMADFLLEIGLEEIPARMLAGAQAELERRVVGMLVRERLVEAGCVAKSFSTPRRLAVLVPGVREQQEDVAEEMTGPSVMIAYKDGVATPAAVAFAKKAGVEVGALRTVTTAKGEYLAATAVKAGRGARQVIGGELPKELAGIYWAKTMYWRAGKPERFVRPVRWMVAMLGNEGMLVNFAGYSSNDVTYGHRVLHGAEQIELTVAGEYEERLRAAYVIVDVEARRHRIRKELDRVCRGLGDGLRWREDHALVDKLTHLTEWPSVIAGAFDAAYLELPEEVLVTVMRDHQSYFAVEDGAGRLAPYFLAVLNTEADEAGQGVIRHGNERVLRARFNDARFFWEFDQRVPLVERVKLLEKVTFQKDLGSYAAKTERVREVCGRLVRIVQGRGFVVDAAALDEAALLAKADLTAELVKEFTELQGEIGGLYARAQGVSGAAADAVYDQYRPASMEDRIARTAEGQMLAIADKADTIAGMFGLGLEPTGSKDPFALRRAANGIVKTLGESEVPLLLSEVAGASGAADGKVAAFFGERVEFYLREARGQAYDVVKAVLAVGGDDVRDAVARAEAVSAVRGSEDFGAVSSAFKRMKNILAQAREKGFASSGRVDRALLRDAAEVGLATAVERIAPEVAAMRSRKDYRGALEAIAGLRPQVDAFFEAVMVMDPDAEVRGNRLALLERVLLDFSGIADFSEIVVAG